MSPIFLPRRASRRSPGGDLGESSPDGAPSGDMAYGAPGGRVMVLAVLISALLAGAGYAAEPSATAQAEIRHLLTHLERSGCDFFRNGRWHTATDARGHLERKYRYLVEKGLVSSAEDFIARAGSESSASGRPYQVRCGTSAPVPSAQWLSDALRRHRSGRARPR